MTDIQKTVEITGDKSGFVSKAAIDRFKQEVKSDDKFKLDELKKKYIKDDYQLIEESKTSINYKFSVSKIVPKNPLETKKELLRARLHNMRQQRTNSFYHKARTSTNVPDDILREYKKLTQMSKVPIPEPSEILANPDQYRPIVSTVLGNTMMKTLPKTHSYVKYFKMIAKAIGAEEALPISTKNFLNNNTTIPNNIENIMQMAGPTNVQGNEMSKDADTDSE